MNLDFTPELVLEAYRAGVFPMADETGDIVWFSPDPRTILPLDTFQMPRSLRQLLRRNAFEIRIDTVFADVIAACGDRLEGTWISNEIRDVYTQLHTLGYAHSVECWQNNKLVGGLYGVAIAGAFFGESMFYRISGASKVALANLVDRMQTRGMTLLDTQWTTEHLARFGAIEIPREEYLRRLKRALALPVSFT